MKSRSSASTRWTTRSLWTSPHLSVTKQETQTNRATHCANAMAGCDPLKPTHLMRYHVELVVPGLTVCGKERNTRTMGSPLGPCLLWMEVVAGRLKTSPTVT